MLRLLPFGVLLRSGVAGAVDRVEHRGGASGLLGDVGDAEGEHRVEVRGVPVAGEVALGEPHRPVGDGAPRTARAGAPRCGPRGQARGP